MPSEPGLPQVNWPCSRKRPDNIRSLNRSSRCRRKRQKPSPPKPRGIPLKRTPGRPKAIYGIARAAQAKGDNATAKQRYQEFLAIWKNSDLDHPEVATAKEFLAKVPAAAQ